MRPSHFRLLRRTLGRPTRKYLKKSRPSPAGNRASHFRQAILPCSVSLGASIVTTLYSARQPGQLKSIGSDLLIVGRDKKEHRHPQKNAIAVVKEKLSCVVLLN